MIYSVHDPVRGGFTYYEGPPQTPINNDQPTPRYPDGLRTRIGVPASLAGRPLPAGSVRTGQGQMPVGAMSSGAPGQWSGTQKSGLPSGLGEFEGTSDAVGKVMAVALGASVLGLLVLGVAIAME